MAQVFVIAWLLCVADSHVMVLCPSGMAFFFGHRACKPLFRWGFGVFQSFPHLGYLQRKFPCCTDSGSGIAAEDITQGARARPQGQQIRRTAYQQDASSPLAIQEWSWGEGWEGGTVCHPCNWWRNTLMSSHRLNTLFSKEPRTFWCFYKLFLNTCWSLSGASLCFLSEKLLWSQLNLKR